MGYNWQVNRLRQYMQRYRSLSRKTFYLAIGSISIFLVIFLIVALYFLPRTEWAIKRHYSKGLSKLSLSVESIGLTFATVEDTKTNLEQYRKTLNGTRDICKQLNGKQLERSRNIGGSLKQSSEGVKKLCEDLIPLLDYSRELHDILKPYLTYEVAAWPPPESKEFSGHLAETQGMIRSTLPRLKKLSYPEVDDPALSEFILQIEAAEKLADEGYTSLTKNETSVTNLKAEQLRNVLRQDKTDFLDARRYFWENTAQIDALQKAITKLRDSLK